MRLETVPGTHFAPEAPLSLSLTGKEGPLPEQVGRVKGKKETRIDLESRLPGPPTGLMRGRLRASVCGDRGDWCVPVAAAFAWEPLDSGGKDFLPLPVWPVPEEGRGVERVELDPGWISDSEQGFTEAVSSQRPVLLAFRAVWCPPCQLMGVEVFQSPEVAPLLSRFVKVVQDADDPSSWFTKSRYQVGGYPTLIVASGDGELVARWVGYPGASATISWLESTLEALGPLVELRQATGPPDIADPGRAASLARRLLDRGELVEATPYVTRAAAANHPAAPLLWVDLAQASEDPLVVAASLGEALRRWPSHRDGPMWAEERRSALAKAGRTEEEEAREQVVKAIHARLPVADLTEIPDLQYLLGQVLKEKDDEGSREAFLASARATEALIVGVGPPGPERYRRAKGWYPTLWAAWEGAGEVVLARALLEELVAAFPDEFTFHNALAGFLERQNAWEPARVEAEAALRHSYGDNRLRAVDLLARVRTAQGDREGAVLLLREALEGLTLPEDPQNRTHRYVRKLRSQLDALLSSATH